jgi:hypothetical protein
MIKFHERVKSYQNEVRNTKHAMMIVNRSRRIDEIENLRFLTLGFNEKNANLKSQSNLILFTPGGTIDERLLGLAVEPRQSFLLGLAT